MKTQAGKMERNERIIEMYMEGYSLNMIASVLKIGRNVVAGVIHCHVKDKTCRQPVKYKVPRKRNRPAGRADRIRIAKEMRAQGFGYEKIGKALNVSRQRAHQMVNDYN